jgi:hypothetical protein
MLSGWFWEFGRFVFALVVTLVVLPLLVFVPPLLYLFVFLPALPGWVANVVCDLSPCFSLALLGFLVTPLLAFGVGIAFLRRFEKALPFPGWM